MTAKTRRTALFATTLLVVMAAFIVAAIQLHRHSAPEAARLLPQSDAVVYFDVKTVRRLTSFKPGSTPHDPDYQQIIDVSGFDPERDLDQVAVAIHSSAVHEARFSYVFVGHYDFEKVSGYLKTVSRAVERYREIDVYEISVENRIVRVALLGLDMAAVSNTDDPAVLRGMIDRYKEIALPFGGPGLVQDYYRYVPIGSLAWGVVRIPAAPQDPRAARNMSLPGGIDIFVPSASTMVASIRFLTSLDFRAEFFTASEADAKHFVDQGQTFLTLFQSIQSNAQLNGSDPDVKAVFNSFQLSQEKDRAVLKADIPLGFIKKLFTEQELAPPAQPAPATPPPAKEEKKAGKKSVKK